MAENEKLLEEIECFLVATGMRASTLGHATVRDGKLVPRLRRGGTVTINNAHKIREFMRDNRPAQGKRRRKPRPKSSELRAA